jgi:hypothetical protein
LNVKPSSRSQHANKISSTSPKGTLPAGPERQATTQDAHGRVVMQRAHAAPPAVMRSGDVLSLQGAIGNRAVQRLLAPQTRAATPVSGLGRLAGQPVIQRSKKGAALKAAFTEIPAGNKKPEFYNGNKHFGSKFAMNATFSPDQVDHAQDGYHTVEYRQYIKGYFKAGSEYLTHKLSETDTMEKDTWHEDGNSPNGYAPYGHRFNNLARSAYNKYTDNAEGSIFEAEDKPSIPVNKGEKVEMCLDFKGELVETDAKSNIVGNNPLESKTWSVKGWGEKGKGSTPTVVTGNLPAPGSQPPASKPKAAPPKDKSPKKGKKTSLLGTGDGQAVETLPAGPETIQRFVPTPFEKVELEQMPAETRKHDQGWNADAINALRDWSKSYTQFRSIIENTHYNVWARIKALYPDSSALPNKLKEFWKHVKDAPSESEEEDAPDLTDSQEVIDRIGRINESQKGADRAAVAAGAKAGALANKGLPAATVREFARALKSHLQQSPLTQNVKAAVLPTYRGMRLLNGFEVAAMRGKAQGVGSIGTGELFKERLYAEHLGFGYPYPQDSTLPKEREDVPRDTWTEGEVGAFDEHDDTPTQAAVPPELRPRYGALDYRNSGQGATPHADFYGRSFFVLKTDVKKRATYTLGDSFNAFSEDAAPHQKVFTYDNLDLLIVKAFYTPDGQKLISYLAERAGAAAIKELGFTTLGGYTVADQYIETQIFGDIRLDQDVQELVLSKAELAALGISDLKALPKIVPILAHVSWRLID